MRKIAELTEAEASMIARMTVCKEACREIVKSVVAEYEMALMADNHIWRHLAKKHHLSRADAGRMIIEAGVLYVRSEGEVCDEKYDEMAAMIKGKLQLDDEE